MSHPTVHRTDTSVQQERAILAAVLPVMPPGMQGLDDPALLTELRSLAETAGALPIDQMVQIRQRPSAATYMGKGKVVELAELAKAREAHVVIFENDLSPSQIRNIEEILAPAKCKVLDRSELILDIFANRARTHEAKLQVELAQMEYTYPRLRAMWTHLERIVGGIGTRGPGEQQLEIDRRIVQQRKAELRREIERVQARKQREVAHRKKDHFLVGLVGYTNAGKSTLFNTMTGADVYADDKLFATLDTRTRKLELGGGEGVMLSDTVGFVRDLPHHLVASFRATLEEAIHADLLLVVLDVADPEAREHLDTVNTVLDDIGADTQPRLLLLNKIDRLKNNAEILAWTQENSSALPISASQGLGLDAVIGHIREQARGRILTMTVRVPMREGKALQFLENRSEVLDRTYDVDSVQMRIRMGARLLDQLRATGARFEIIEPDAASESSR